MTEKISEERFKQVIDKVSDVLGADDSGHGIDHVMRVHDMSVRFASTVPEDVDDDVVRLAALLHDVDDYKLVGKKQSGLQNNAVEIMSSVGIDSKMQITVKNIIANMGYSKSLRGVRPAIVEGKIVSDADMCDAIGASGVIRALTYAMSDKGSGVIFNRQQWPAINITAEQYNVTGNTHDTDNFINHFFEKLLKLKGMMMTQPGRKEASVRDQQMIDFLRSYFRGGSDRVD